MMRRLHWPTLLRDGEACLSARRHRRRCYRTGVRLGEPIPAALCNAEVYGSDGTHRLGNLLRGSTLVLFLRHFG